MAPQRLDEMLGAAEVIVVPGAGSDPTPVN